MTEEQAKKKMCPIVSGQTGLNPTTMIKSKVFCIASDCMMWKKEDGVYREVIKGEKYEVEDAGSCGLTSK